MKELYQKYKKEIGVGVIVSLITATIMKIGDWMVEIIPLIGISISESFTNVLYYLAATCTDTIPFILLAFVGFGIVVYITFPHIIDSFETYKSIVCIEKEIETNSIENNGKISEKSIEKNKF